MAYPAWRCYLILDTEFLFCETAGQTYRNLVSEALEQLLCGATHLTPRAHLDVVLGTRIHTEWPLHKKPVLILFQL